MHATIFGIFTTANDARWADHVRDIEYASTRKDVCFFLAGGDTLKGGLKVKSFSQKTNKKNWLTDCLALVTPRRSRPGFAALRRILLHVVVKVRHYDHHWLVFLLK